MYAIRVSQVLRQDNAPPLPVAPSRFPRLVSSLRQHAAQNPKAQSSTSTRATHRLFFGIFSRLEFGRSECARKIEMDECKKLGLWNRVRSKPVSMTLDLPQQMTISLLYDDE